MSKWLALAALVLAFVLGGLLAFRLARHEEPALPDTPAVVARVREVARLESLDVSLYKKVDFAPDPRAQDSLWSSLSQWAQYATKAPRGRAIVFAVAHLSVDLRKLDASGLRVSGRTVEVVLPKVETRVELLPAETEIIGSNLDSQQTAELFERAKAAFQAQVASDVGLQQRARVSAQLSLRSIFSGLGFQEVKFVDQLSAAKHG
jgi:Protein of unknown function (DUF4230)